VPWHCGGHKTPLPALLGPFCRVKGLPFKDAGLGVLMQVLLELQGLVEKQECLTQQDEGAEQPLVALGWENFTSPTASPPEQRLNQKRLLSNGEPLMQSPPAQCLLCSWCACRFYIMG
jgi:hypothetical protein